MFFVSFHFYCKTYFDGFVYIVDKTVVVSSVKLLFCVSAILYELLYERVFDMDQPVRLALEMIYSKPLQVHASDGNTDKTR